MVLEVEHTRKYSLEERREISSQIFPQQGVVSVFDLHEAVEARSVADHLIVDRKANPAHVRKIFSDGGEWILVDTSKINLYETPVAEVDSHMRAVTLDIGNLLQIHIDGQKSHGFNLHNASHIDYVTQTGRDLLDHSGHRDGRTLRRFIMAARGHDLGNVVSRKMHSTVSSRIVEKIFPSVTTKPKAWDIVSRAIELHDEKVLLSVIDSWGPLSAEQIVIRLRDLGPELLALVIADKVHIGPGRVPKNIDTELMDVAVNDPHVEVNEYLETNKVGMFHLGRDNSGKWIEIPDKKTLSWLIDFTPPKLGRLHGRVSERVRALHDSGQPYINGIENLFYEIYHSRISLTVLSAFALYPQLETVEIILKDRISGERRIHPFYKVPPPYDDKDVVPLNEKIKLLAVQHGYAPSVSKRKGGARDYL